jgi:hypothetical protein
MSSEQQSLLNRARADFIAALLKGQLSVDADGVPSIADKGSDISKGIARALLTKLGETIEREKASGQTAGKSFEVAVADFLRATFLNLPHLRPGNWEVIHGSQRSAVRISNFQQYHHLVKLADKAKHDPDLRAALSGDYFIEPDVVVVRHAETDEFIDGDGTILDAGVANLTPLRATNPSAAPGRLLHASISCKWTIRSDRSQNARTEALNLIRNRNGHVPHIVVITAEPMPKRISSIAQGTSDLDCVYHIALPELRFAVIESLEGRRSEQAEDLEMLIAGKRLRDIADLPLDLAI